MVHHYFDDGASKPEVNPIFMRNGKVVKYERVGECTNIVTPTDWQM